MLNVAYSHWQVKDEEFPYKGQMEEKIAFLLKYAILAPSTFNSQPWLCSIEQGELTICLNRSRVTKTSDKSGRFAVISIGCFVENVLIAAKHFSLNANLTYLNPEEGEDSPILKVQFTEIKAEQSDGDELFKFIKSRATNRSLSRTFVLDEALKNQMQSQLSENAGISILNTSKKDELVKISQEADLRIWSNMDFRKEHVQWVRNNLTRQPDGMPAFGVGVGLVASFLAKPVILSAKFPSIQAKKNELALESSNDFIVLTSSKDNYSSWLDIGRTFERISLLLTSKGLSAAPMGQFVEDDIARASLGKLVGSHQLPQVFFRINLPSKPVKHSPRLAVNDIIIAAK